MSKKIIGVTVGTPTPRANLKQTDPRKADYVKGKDIIPTKASQLENDAGYLSEDDISGITPHIGVNGNWYLGETDTGVKAEVPEFELKHYTANNAAGVKREGIEIRIVTRDENGEEITQSTGVVWGTEFEATGGLDSPGGSSGGASGSGTAVVTAPHIGENGNWFIGETDTGVKAQGEDGVGIADIQKRTVAGREVLYIILSDGVEKGFALPVPEVSGGGYVAQDTAPEDTTLLWVDTSDDSDDDYQEAVNAALAQAKASGEFDGKDGNDYVLTDTDRAEIAEQAAQMVIDDAPVKSVNGKTGAVTLAATDVGARPSTWTPSATDVGADPKGTANTAVTTHNVSTDAHNDMRLLIDGLTSRLNALANSTDEDLDQMAEMVAYIKENRELISGITTNKVNVADIINNLTTNVSNKPLSAAQGVALKALIDAITVPTKLSELTNDKGYITGYTETDPTVPSWAKATSKPSYTASEVGAVPTSRTVNGKALSANISLSASDVGARASTWTPSAAEIKSALGYTPANQATTITITGKDADGNTHTFTVVGWEA